MATRRPPHSFSLYWGATKGSFTHISENNLALVSAGIAFFVMLSLFPALAALIALLGIVSDPQMVVAQMEELRGLLPTDVYEIIYTQVTSLVSTSSDQLGWAGLISLFLALWSARAGVGAMILGLNSVYEEQNRNLARHYIRALWLTLVLVLVGIVALLALVVVPVVLAFFPLGGLGTFLVEVIRWCVAVGVVLVGVGVLYRFGPNRKAARVPWLSTGAILATVAWLAVSIGFSFYVSNFGNYNQVYGSIGAVIAMLVWLWISSFLVLLGAAFNSQIEQRTKIDSTVGKPKKMGERGAYAADTFLQNN